MWPASDDADTRWLIPIRRARSIYQLEDLAVGVTHGSAPTQSGGVGWLNRAITNWLLLLAVVAIVIGLGQLLSPLSVTNFATTGGRLATQECGSPLSPKGFSVASITGPRPGTFQEGVDDRVLVNRECDRSLDDHRRLGLVAIAVGLGVAAFWFVNQRAKSAASITGYPPGWQPDPLGTHAWRWWDGRVWADHVSDETARPDDGPQRSEL